jgi:hypothetical protein
LRIGLAQQTILMAVAHACASTEDAVKSAKIDKRQELLVEAVNIVKQVFRYDYL